MTPKAQVDRRHEVCLLDVLTIARDGLMGVWQYIAIPFFGSGFMFGVAAVNTIRRFPTAWERRIDKTNDGLFVLALGLFFWVLAAWMWHW